MAMRIIYSCVDLVDIATSSVATAYFGAAIWLFRSANADEMHQAIRNLG